MSEDLETLLKTVVLMELVGLFNTAKKLKKYIHKISLIKEIELEAFDFLSNEEARKIISETNRKNASGARNLKIMSVSQLCRQHGASILMPVRTVWLSSFSVILMVMLAESNINDG